MNVLLIKMSSMGDLIHTLPALTDAMNAIPDLEIDWVVEPAFADIPTWHPVIKNIIPIPLRRWRKNSLSSIFSGEIIQFCKTLRQKKYDLIIDAQGLLKSAIVANVARGETHGYDNHSAREYISGYFHRHQYAIPPMKDAHAVTRTRLLFSKALNYALPNTRPNFHIDFTKLPALDFVLPEKYVVFLHGTTWETKHYPEIYWRQLVEKVDALGITTFLPWGNEIEKDRAERLVKNTQHAKVLSKISITQMATFLKNATAVVAGDTGLGHLSAALTTPTIGLYGPTDPKLVGIIGDNQFHLQAQFPCAPCYSKTCWYAKTADHSVDRNAAVARFSAINLFKMLDGLTSTPALLKRFIAKNHGNIDVLPAQTMKPDLVVPSCYATIDPDKVWKLLEKIIGEK